MNPLSFISTPRSRKLILPFCIFAICTVCLWSTLCGTSDITDNPSENGGYNRGAIFFLQSPIAVSGKSFAHPLPLVMSNASDILIPAGCSLQIVRVRSLDGTFAVPADNIPRMSASAKFLDGPIAGSTVDITWISARTHPRRIKLDPTYLQATHPPPRQLPNPAPTPPA